MSSTIDDRIVSLEFDNKQFEQGVSESLNTLEKLKNSLELDDAGKSLSKISDEAKKIDLSHVSDSVDQLNERFSTLRLVGLMALSNLVDGAMNLAKKFGSVLTAPIRQAASGGWNRALNIEEAKFQLEGLGVAWKDISEDINYGVQDTAYGLDAAAKAASQLVASGVKVGDSMKHSLLAISGVAAMTSSSYEEISPIFTTVAGQGKLMTMQLRQLESRGLNAAAVLGQQLGKSEAEIRDMVTKGKISFNEFSDAMYEAFGEHAKDANNTFMGSLSNVKAALNKIGAEFATPLMNNVVPVFNSLRLMINGIKANMGETFKIFEVLTRGIGTKLSGSIDRITDFLNNRFTGVKNLNNALYIMTDSLIRIGKVIGTAFKIVFNGSMGDHINNLARGIEKIAKLMQPTHESLNGLQSVLVVIFSIIKKIGQLVGFIIKNIGGPIFTIITKTVHLLFTLISVISRLSVGLTRAISESKAFQLIIKGMGDVAEKVKDFFGNLKTNILGTSDSFSEAGSKIKDVLSTIKNIVAALLALPIIGIYTAFNKLRSLDFTKLSNALTNIKKIIVDLFNRIRSSKVVTSVINTLAMAGSTLVIVLVSLGRRISEFFNKLVAGEITLDTIRYKFEKMFTSISRWIKGFKFENVTKNIKDFVKSVKDLGFLETLTKKASNIGGIVGKILTSAIEKIKEFINKIKSSGSIFEYLIEKIKEFVKELAGANSMMSTSIAGVGTGAGALIGANSNGIVKFLDLVKNKFTGFKDLLINGMKKLREDGMLTKAIMVAFIFGIIKALFTFSSSTKKITNAMAEGTGMFKAFAGFGDFMRGLLNPLNALSEFIKGINDAYVKAHQKTPAEQFAIVMKSMAISIALLVGSVVILYKAVDDIDKFKTVALGLGIFITAMVAVAGAMAIISSSVQRADDSAVSAFVANILAMTLAIKVMASAVKKLGEMKPSDLYNGLGAVALLGILFTTLQLALSKVEKTGVSIVAKLKGIVGLGGKIIAASTAFILVATSLLLMVAAMKKLRDLHLSTDAAGAEDIVLGLVYIGGIFSAIIGLSKLCGAATKGILQVGGAMALLGSAATQITLASLLMRFVKPEDLLKMAAVYSTVVLLFGIIAKFGGGTGTFKAIAGMGLAFSLLANATVKLVLVSLLTKHLDATSILKTLGIFVTIMGSLLLVLKVASGFKNGQSWKPILATLIGLTAIIGALIILSFMVSNDKVFHDVLKATGLLAGIMVAYGALLHGAGNIKSSKGVGAILATLGALATIIGGIYLLLPFVQNTSDLIKVAGIAAILEVALLGLIKITEAFLKFGKDNKLGNGKWMIKSFISLGLMIVAFGTVAGILIATSRLANWYEIATIAAALSGSMLALMLSMSVLIKATDNIKVNDLLKASGKMAVMIGIIGIISLVFITLSDLGSNVSTKAIAQTVIVAYALVGLLFVMGKVVDAIGDIDLANLGKATIIFVEFIALFAIVGLVISNMVKAGANAKSALAISQVIMLCLAEFIALGALIGLLSETMIPAMGAIPILLVLIGIFAVLGAVIAIMTSIGVEAKSALAISQVIMLCLLELIALSAVVGLLAGLELVSIAGSLGLLALIGVMYILSKFIQSIIPIDTKTGLAKIEDIKTLLWSLIGMLAVLSLLGVGGVIGATSLVILAAGLTLLAVALDKMQDIDFRKLSNGIQDMGVALAILVGLGLVGSLAGAGLIVFAAGITAFGLACIAASVGVTMFMAVMGKIGEKISEAVSGVVDGAGKMADGFKEKFGKILEFAQDIINTLRTKITGVDFKGTGKALGDGLVAGFRAGTGWHSPPKFLIDFFRDCGVAVNNNASGITDLFEGTGTTWASALSKALNLNLDGILNGINLGSLDLSNPIASINSLMNMLDYSKSKTQQQQKALVELYSKGQMSATDFDREMKKLNQTTEKSTNMFEDMKDATLDLGSAMGGAGSKVQSFQESLKSTLESQMNIFQKFEQKTAMSKDELLANMRSQIEGMTNWAAQMQQLATMGIDKGLYQKLAEMGPQGAEYVGAFASMTAEEMAAANEMWAQSLVLPGQISHQLNASWSGISGDMVNGLSKGWTDKEGVFRENILATSQLAQEEFKSDNGIASPSKVYYEMGHNMMLGLRNGIAACGIFPRQVLQQVSDICLNTAKAGFSEGKYYTIGYNVGQGIYNGLKAGSGPIYSLMADIGAKAEEVLRKVTQVRSPSRVFQEIGMYWDLGLAKGIDDNANAVYSAIDDMGYQAIEVMKYTVAQIASELTNTIEDPVITPVLDLSRVQAGIRTLNSSFNNNRMMMNADRVMNLQNAQQTPANISFTQNNYSPKSLSRMDIYRDTKNMFAQAKGALGS